MAEWRLLRGWNDAELAQRLSELRFLPRTAPARWSEMSREGGWGRVRSSAVIGHEPPGPPLPAGAFARAWAALGAFAFSDPDVVLAHYDPAHPLSGRYMLLELRVLGLRYLCPVRVTEVLGERMTGAIVRGVRYDTIAGHLERGAEWLLLAKDERSGEITSSIVARWRHGDFPNWWSRVGFAVLGPHYQKRWHRRAHRRLASLALRPGTALPARGRLAHEGPRVSFERDLSPRTAPAPHRSSKTRLLCCETRSGAMLGSALAIGAMTGVRSTFGLAAIASSRAGTGAAAGESAVERWISTPGLEAGLRVACAGEMLADKLSVLPARSEPVPLAGRAALGAVSAALLARRRGRSALAAAVAGAAAAVAVAVAATRIRAWLGTRGTPDPLVGIAEDAILFASARVVLAGGAETPVAHRAFERRSSLARRRRYLESPRVIR